MEHVKYLLKNYRCIKGKIELLKGELNGYRGISDVEAIESLIFAKQEGEKVSNSIVSDKTGNTALSYGDHVKKLESEAKQDIREDILLHENEIMILECAVNSLSLRESKIIKDVYFNEKTQCEIAYDLNITDRWLVELKKKALQKLALRYEEYSKVFIGGANEANENVS